MANSTQAVDAPIREGIYTPLALAAVQIYKGCAASIVNGTGFGTPLVAANGATSTFVGVFTETYNGAVNPFTGATASAGSYFTTILRSGLIQWAQTGTTITAANIGQEAFFSDDHTITLTSGTMAAGIITSVDANGNVWVDISNAVRSSAVIHGSVVVSTQPAAVTITNVNGSAQLFASAAIPANTLQAGDRIRVRMQLVGVTRTSTDTTALALQASATNAVGGTALFTVQTAFAHATTNFVYAEAELIVQSIGASGAVLGGGFCSAGTAGATLSGLNVGSTTVATNATLYIVLSGTYSASNTTDQVSVNIFDVDVSR